VEERKYVARIEDAPKHIWKPPRPGEPESIVTLMDGQDLVTTGPGGVIQGSEKVTMLVQNYRPGGSHKRHAHDDCEQVFFVLDGEGEFLLDEEWFDVSKGDVIFVPPHVTHAARNNTEGMLRIIFISVPLK